jgi:hypothetical protein
MTTPTVIELRRNGNPVGERVELARDASTDVGERRLLRPANHRRDARHRRPSLQMNVGIWDDIATREGVQTVIPQESLMPQRGARSCFSDRFDSGAPAEDPGGVLMRSSADALMRSYRRRGGSP